MGVHKNISHDKFPKQGMLLGREVKVCFNYDPSHTFNGLCIRDDVEEPFRTLFSITDGRTVAAVECQYSYD